VLDLLRSLTSYTMTIQLLQVRGLGGGQQLLVRGHPVGWLVLCPPCSRHIPEDTSLPCVPRPRGSGWPSTRCGNTARTKRWWPRPKSSSRTGRGCWVSDVGQRQVPTTPPWAVPAPQTP